MKRCSKCGKDKPLTEFHSDKTRADGLARQCKDCKRANTRAWNAANSEQKKAASREWYEANKDLAYQRSREWVAQNHEVAKRHKRESAVRSRERDPATYRLKKRLHVKGPIPDGATDYARLLVNDPCSYCGGPAGTIDHIEPGDNNEWDNLTAACHSCNSRKRTRPLLVFLALRTPGADGEDPAGSNPPDTLWPVQEPPDGLERQAS